MKQVCSVGSGLRRRHLHHVAQHTQSKTGQLVRLAREVGLGSNSLEKQRQ